MKYFTPEGLNPSEKTLLLIKQIAYAYNSVLNNNDKTSKSMCLN